jgi:cyanoexosortase A
MKVTHPVSVRSSPKSQYWLLGIAAALVAIYMTLIWIAGNTAHFGMSVLFYLCAGIVFWEKRHSLLLRSGVASKVIGAVLIGFCLWQSVGLLHDPKLTSDLPNPVLRLFPFVSALAIGLLASGFKGLKQHRQELILLFFLGAPSVLFSFLPDISPITARFSAFLLGCVGFNVSLQDVYIRLPSGAVKVYTGCSGIESITYLLGLSAIALILFPVARMKSIFVPILAMLIGFAVNGVRVAIMAVLATSNTIAFDYWHKGDGSLIFGVIAVFAFGACYWLLHKHRQVSNQKF